MYHIPNLQIVSLKLPGSIEDSGGSKTFGIGALVIEMAVLCKCGFRANCQLG